MTRTLRVWFWEAWFCKCLFLGRGGTSEEQFCAFDHILYVSGEGYTATCTLRPFSRHFGGGVFLHFYRSSTNHSNLKYWLSMKVCLLDTTKRIVVCCKKASEGNKVKNDDAHIEREGRTKITENWFEVLFAEFDKVWSLLLLDFLCPVGDSTFIFICLLLTKMHSHSYFCNQCL